MNNCINTKIETALKDENILKLMNKASKRFRNQLDSDAIKSCQLNALWKTFLNYDETKGASFTTYLYKGVFIECIKEVKFNSRNICRGKLHDNISSNKDNFLIIDILDEFQNDEDKNLIIDRLANMTISEISAKNSKNRETVRKKINKLTDKLKNNFS